MDAMQRACFFDALNEIGFVPNRIVVSKALYAHVKELCVELMSHRVIVCQQYGVLLRTHPGMPDDYIALFGAEGSCAVIKLEKSDEECY